MTASVGLGPATADAPTTFSAKPITGMNQPGSRRLVARTRTYCAGMVPGANGTSVFEN